MRYSPKPCNKKAIRLTWLLIAAGVLCFCLTPIFPAGRAAFQLGAVVLMGCGVFVAVRYCMTEFTYELAVRDGADAAISEMFGETDGRQTADFDFTVRKTQGRRGAILDACFSLAELRYFAPLPKEGGREREPYRRFPAMRVYNYTVSLSPASQYMAVFVDAAQNAFGLILEADGEMVQLMQRAVEKNRIDRDSL